MRLLADVTKDCLDLPSSQRLKLARILIDLSEPVSEFSPDNESAWEEEIAARVEAVRNGSAQARTVAQAFSDLDARYPS